MGVFDKIKAAAEALADKVGSVKSVSMDKIRSMLDELNVAFTQLEGVGYHVTDVELALGLPPSITVYLVKQGEPTDEAFAALLANNKGRKTARTLIRLVRQANNWAESLRWGERRCRMVAVELGLRPAVRLVYAGQGVPATPLSPIEQKAEVAAPGAVLCTEEKKRIEGHDPS
jgi:hypothetical protein